MLEGNLMSLNIANLGANSFLGAHAAQSGLGLGNLAQINPLADLDLQQLAPALPYIGLGAGATVLGLLGAYGVRLWRRHQASLPPPGMKDIRPGQMQAFFDRHATDRPATAEILLGYSSLALQASLEETARVIASEKADLAAAAKAARVEKDRKVIEGLLQSFEHLETLVNLRRGQVARASDQWLARPDEIHASVVERLGKLRRYRVAQIDEFFRRDYLARKTEIPEVEATPAIASHYASLEKSQKAALYTLAISVWQALSKEDKEFFWDLRQPNDPERSVMLPPDFLTLFAHMVPQPLFPLNKEEMLRRLPVLLSGRLVTLRQGPELPAFFRDGNSIVIFRTGETRIMADVQIARRLGVANVVATRHVTSPSGEEKVIRKQYAPEDVLAIRPIRADNDDDDKDHAMPGQVEWTHPGVKLSKESKHIPGMVVDLQEYPAYSLGEDHRVLVDYLDAETVHFLRSIRAIREKIEKLPDDKRDAVTVAEALWKHMKAKFGTPDPEQLAKRAGPGKVHDLLDVAYGTGRSEFAIVMQMVFQYMGIPSRLEEGVVKSDRVRTVHPYRQDKDEVEVPTHWVRLMVPGRRQRILCGGLDQPLLQDDPAFGAFADQTPQSGAHAAPGVSPTADTVMAPLPSATPSMLPPLSVAPQASGIIETDPSRGEVTPLPGPVPPPVEDDQPTRLVPNAALAGAPEDPDEDVHDRQTVVAVNPINFQMMKQGLDAELAERYPLIADRTSPTASYFIQRLREKIVEAWQNAGQQPPLEADDAGVPTVMPEQFINETVKNFEIEVGRNTSDVAQKIISQWIDSGDRAERRRKKALAAAAAPASTPEPALPPLSPEIAPPASGRATPPPLPNDATTPRPAVPPPPPQISLEEAVRAEAERRDAELLETAENVLKWRYPSFTEPSEHAIMATLAKKIHKAAGGDANRMLELAEGYVGKMMTLVASDPAHEHRLRSLRGADAIMEELQERYPVLSDNDWKGFALEALGKIFHLWQIQYSPWDQWAGAAVIPEKIFERGFTDFTSGLTTNFPETEPEVFHQAFIEGDQGPREKRYAAPEAEIEEDIPPASPAAVPAQAVPASAVPAPAVPAPAVTDVSSVRQKPAGLKAETITARIRDLYPAIVGMESALRTFIGKIQQKESEDGFDLDRTIHALAAVLIKSLSDRARVGTALEDHLKALIETGVASELRERYRVFREPRYNAAVARMAKRVYDIWTSHNRTFNGTSDVLPLRVPEKFVNEGMDSLIRLLRDKDPGMAGEIVASFTGYRADREKAGRAPSSPPAGPAIPISETTILIELKDRYRKFAGENEALIGALAKTIYKTWLREDPARDGEKNGLGRRGLVPEVYLEMCRRDLYDRLVKRGLREIRDAMEANDRGTRTKRGTDLVEFDIQEALARAG